METVLHARNITKRFPGVLALKDVSLEVKRGQVLALVGENGAGKSTLMKIISGVYQQDEGEIWLRGQPVTIRSPRDAQRQRISTIHQELLIVPHLSVAANICLSNLPTHLFPGYINKAAMNARGSELMEQLGVKIDPETPVTRLSVAERQLVEIAKALSHKADILVMDEPTSALNDAEVKSLLGIVRKLQASGVGVIYISHRMEEIFAVCDSLTVLRDGESVISRPLAGLSRDDVVAYMVGRALGHQYPQPKAPSDDQPALLEVRNLTVPGRFQDVSFALGRGEILGLAGLMGSGRSEVAAALFGLVRGYAGEIRVEGRSVELRSPKAAIRQGIAYVPSDRKDQGLILGMSVRNNATMTVLRRLARLGFINRRQQAAKAEGYVQQLGIRTAGIEQAVTLLSGGNQQKVVIAKWLATRPKVLILDEPTRGIDVGAKSEIHHLLRRLTDEGMGVVVISSETPELLGLSDRVVVMYEGRVTATLARSEATEQSVNRFAHGPEALGTVLAGDQQGGTA